MRSRSLVSLVAVLAVVGCDSTPVDPPPGPPPPPVLPLVVGTAWTLARTYSVSYTPDGSARDTTRTPAGSARTYTLTVTRDTVVAGETWVHIEVPRVLSHAVFDGAGWFANRADGLYRLQPATGAANWVYALGVAEGVPFLQTDVVTAVLADDDATFALPSETVTVRQYDRTWKRLERTPSVRGPIDPNPVTRDQFSSQRGPVALEVSYVQASPSVPGAYVPKTLVRYERVEATAARAEAGPGPAEPRGAYPVR